LFLFSIVSHLRLALCFVLGLYDSDSEVSR
jgi:hypothetical protein